MTKDNMVYILKRTELKNITEHQLKAFISEFDLDDEGNVLIPYQHKGYIVAEEYNRKSWKTWKISNRIHLFMY